MANDGSSGWGQAAGASAAAGMSVLGSAWQAYRDQKAAKYNTDRTIEANKEAAELAWLRSKEMWNMQNAYNSPQSQMERFKAAGLNPHLIYGQGSAGNASQMPSYNPPDIQYKYSAGNYGAAISSMLPLMMSVGSWAVDMQLKNQQLKQGEENLYTSDLKQLQLQQLVDYLREKNPKVLQEMENKLSLFPYQLDMTRTARDSGNAKLQDLVNNLNYQWGVSGSTGVKEYERQRLIQSLEAGNYKNRLLKAQSAYTDLDITNPQGLAQMALSTVASFMGKTINFRKPSAGKINQRKRNRIEGKNYSYDRHGRKTGETYDYGYDD